MCYTFNFHIRMTYPLHPNITRNILVQITTLGNAWTSLDIFNEMLVPFFQHITVKQYVQVSHLYTTKLKKKNHFVWYRLLCTTFKSPSDRKKIYQTLRKYSVSLYTFDLFLFERNYRKNISQNYKFCRTYQIHKKYACETLCQYEYNFCI